MRKRSDDFSQVLLTKKEKELMENSKDPAKYSNSNLIFAEYDLEMNLNDPYLAETSVINFFVSLGFSQKDAGCQYLIHIMNKCLEDMKAPQYIKTVYDECGGIFNVSPKNVEISIINAIKNAAQSKTSNKLSKLNDIFKCDYVIDNKISNAMFITAVANRFVLSKKYEKSIYYVAPENNKT